MSTQNARSLADLPGGLPVINGPMARLLNMGSTFARVSKIGHLSRDQLSVNLIHKTKKTRGPLLDSLGTYRADVNCK